MRPDLVKLLAIIVVMVLGPLVVFLFKWWCEFLDRKFRDD